MDFLVSIVVLGATYALLAAGIVIVYKASRVVNFAHGELAIVGAYVFWSAGIWSGGVSTSVPALLLTIGITAAISALFGAVIYLALMRRLLGQPTFVAAMVTIGVAIILKAMIVVVWNARSVGIGVGRQTLYTYVEGGRLTVIDLVTIVAAIVFFTALFLFFHGTRLGRQFRGAAENPLL